MALAGGRPVTGGPTPAAVREPPEYRGWLIIEWPPMPPETADHPWPDRFMTGKQIQVIDALTGRPLYVTAIQVNATAEGIVTAEVTMPADALGEPVPWYWLEGSGHAPAGVAVADPATGALRTGTYTFLIAGMRVRPDLSREFADIRHRNRGYTMNHVREQAGD